MPSNLINVPINVGTRPDWQTRLGYPQIFNMFVGSSGYVYPSPGLEILTVLEDARAMHYTTFNGGGYVVVTNTGVFRISLNGNLSLISGISFSGQPVQIAENLQNQVTIVDGRKAWVFSQRVNTFQQLTVSEGFSFTSPCSVVELNTFTIVLDRDSGQWIISDPNNALVYQPLNTIAVINSELETAISLATLNNNLYIFGTQGIERWMATTTSNIYVFPFQRDENFRIDYGTISAASIARGNGVIYFLSSKFIPMQLTGSDVKPIAEDGMAKIISQYVDIEQSIGSYYSFRDNYFFHLTFPTTAISWVYNQSSNTWALGDDLIVSSDQSKELVLTKTGLFNLSLRPAAKKRSLITPRLDLYKGQQTYRNTLHGVELEIIQGFYQTNEPQNVDLFISLDAISWLNGVRRPIGRTGQRNDITIWRTNLTSYDFTLRFEYYGDYDFVIERVSAIIN